ncbi:MAG: DUF4258 domain-containing protein [Rhizomicrobium sp.]
MNAGATFLFTNHALAMLAERQIDQAWVEQTLIEPDWTEYDPAPDRMRAFRAIPEAENHILRVVYRRHAGEFRLNYAIL